VTDGWVVVVTPTARRDVRRLDPQIRRRVLGALDELIDDPRGGKLRKLTGHNDFRLRVGDWRVIVELDDNARAIVVHHVLPRGRVYDR
jgi:mRNA interferase RelE/StbE